MRIETAQPPSWETKTPPPALTPSQKPTIAPLISDSLSIQPQFQPPITSRLNIELQDQDGFTNFGQNDLQATVNGTVNINSDFILSQLSRIQSNEEVHFDAPRFDSQNKQYVISGKALNKILGIFDIGFEVRLGVQDGQLAFDVDNWLKRGIIYHVLSKQLEEKIGLETEKKNHLLTVKPNYQKPIPIPLKNGHTGRIDKIESDSKKISFDIHPNGQLQIKLSNTALNISTDTQNSHPSQSQADTAHLNLNLNLDESLQPHLQATDLSFKSSQGQGSAETLDLQLGESELTVNVKNLNGQLETNGLSANMENLSGQLKKSPDRTLDIQANGSLQGQIEKDGLTGSFQTQGDHHVSIANQQVTVDIEQANIDGDYIPSSKKETEKKNQSDLQIHVNDLSASGSFQNPRNQLQFSGQVTGATDLHLAPSGQIDVTQHQGTVDIHFNKGDQIQIDGKGEQATFSMSPTQDIDMQLNNIDLNTQVNANEHHVQTHTIGQQAHVSIQQDQVHVQTTHTQSDVDLQLKEAVRGQGTVQDVQLDVEADTVKVKAQKADFKTQISNKKGNLALNVHTRANLDLQIEGNQVQMSSKSGQTHAQLTVKDSHTQKVRVTADGQDFNLQVQQENIDLTLNQMTYQAQVTPNEKVRVTANSQSAGSLSMAMQTGDSDTDIQIQSQSPIQGRFSLEQKLNTAFQNTSGFQLHIQDGKKTSAISTTIAGVNFDGNFQAKEVQAGLNGQGDFQLDIQNQGAVNLQYNGTLQGQTHLPNQAEAGYSFQGPINMSMQQQNVNISTGAPIDIQSNDTPWGLTGAIQLKPGQIEIKDGALALHFSETGTIELGQLQHLKLENKQVITLLSKLQANQVGIRYEDFNLENNGQNMSVKLQSDPIDTEYGKLSVKLDATKQDESIQIPQGHLSLTPNQAFYDLVEESISKKYNITIKGTPTFENGEIRVKGEVRTALGLLQLADFNVKATVEDNKLVFELDKAKVLQVIGTNTASQFLKKTLDKTDIDVFRRSNHTLEITMADVVKDLSLTQGINFTELKLIDNRFEADFYFSSQDKIVAQLASKDERTILKKWLAENPVTSLSGESISTAFNAFARGKDVATASQLMTQVTQAYTQTQDSKIRFEMERALQWMVKSTPAHKQNISDNIALAFVLSININTPQGQTFIRQLPLDVIETLANNMDQTLTQGGGWSMISSQERTTANQLRTLRGLPLNYRGI